VPYLLHRFNLKCTQIEKISLKAPRLPLPPNPQVKQVEIGLDLNCVDLGTLVSMLRGQGEHHLTFSPAKNIYYLP
jgi:hypothetical protein